MDDYTAFYAILDDYKQRPFVWGDSDCSLFVADCLLALKSVDYAAPFRGKYDNQKTAYKALKKYGGIDGYLNGLFEAIPPNLARRGDIIKVGGDLFSVGISAGQTTWFMDEAGIKNIPTKLGVAAWRVV